MKTITIEAISTKKFDITNAFIHPHEEPVN